jgi:hypothetical protein
MTSTWHSARRAVSALGLVALAGAATFAVPEASRGSEPAATVSLRPAVRLVTQEQFANSITAIFGADVLPSLRFPPLKRVEGLSSLGSASAMVTPGAFEQFDAVARAIAGKVTDEQHRAFLIGCSPAEESAGGRTCARRFLERTGRLVFRRPLSSPELDLYTRIADEAAKQGGGLYDGIAFALSGMLVSPKALLVAETTEADPRTTGRRPDGYAKASRLSLLLWNAFPDDALLTAAAAGELHSAAGLTRQIDRMLASPRAEVGVRAFFKDWMLYDGFDTLTKDSVIYPAFTRRIAADAEEQALRTIVHHVRSERDYRDIFTTRDIFVSRELGPIQNLAIDQRNAWELRRLPADSPRAGILTLPAFLALHSHPGRSSVTLRGKALREIFMCQHVPPPPPNVNFSIVEDPTHVRSTGRERVAAHLENAACAGCHKITDPIGLALEKFDGAGQFRLTENGQTIDTSGELGGVKFGDAIGLGQAVRNDPATAQCLVSRLYAYSLGKPLGEAEEARMEVLAQSFAQAKYRYNALLRMIVLDETFFGAPAIGPAPTVARLSR